MLRVVRRRAEKLKRFNALALLCVSCLMLSACTSLHVAEPIEYALNIDARAGSPDKRMIPAETENGLVYRYMLDGLEDSSAAIVKAGGHSTAIGVELNRGRAVVEYRPGSNELLQLPGSWHLFSYTPGEDVDPKTVHLAGSFNGWSTHALPMFDRGDGVYVALVKLSEGVHWYKFVADGETWINDPASDTEFERPDGNYGKNSAVLIGVDARGLSEPKPNHIEASAVIHDPSDVPDVAAASGSLLRLSIRVQAGDVEQVSVLVAGESDSRGWMRYALQPSGGHVGLERYGALIQVTGGPVRYIFELIDGGVTLYRSADGLSDSLDKAKRSAYTCDMRPGFVTPDWAKDAVWYQIFPERFRNGETSNDPPDMQRWQADWWATLSGEVEGEENFYRGHGNVWRRRFGGDIQGVQEALPYLRELGVNTLYFNPVFEARSMHKYDTSDFRHIDDNFTVKGDPADLAGETDDPATWRWSAGDKVFLAFIQEAHRQGFKVILDGVFNHVGEKHYAFVDVLENGRDSVYADWFDIIDWGTGGKPGKPGGIQWRGWDHDNGQLPLLKKDVVHGLADGPRQHIFDITRRWMAPNGDASAGVDGWRLDVAPDIPHPFWVEWRGLVKSINPDAMITGEVWTWAQPWLEGDQFDAVMNYQFAIPAQDFFADADTAICPAQFSTLLNQLVYAYPLQAALVMQNLIDSHDTDRLASMFVNPDRGYDTSNRLQDTGPDYSLDKPDAVQRKRMMQAIVCQMTFVGAPMVYYGTEAGMWSPDDPSNRQPMIWRDLLPYDNPAVTFDGDMFGWYQRLTALRSGLPALRRGFYRTLIADDDLGVLAYARDLDHDHVYIVINRSPEPREVVLSLAAGDRDTVLINWLDPSQARVVPGDADDPAARPTLAALDGAGTVSGIDASITLRLEPYGSAVLSQRKQVP
jgi:cyclomaltodextrinase / maltogenic alpha-amylase / neopullulanase